MRPHSRTRKFAYFILVIAVLIGGYKLFLSLTEGRPDAIMFSPNTQYGDNFGAAIAVDGETIVAGAPGNPSIGKSGAAYVYNYFDKIWQLQAKLTEPNPRFKNQEGFAQYVAVNKNRIAVSGDVSSIRSYKTIYIFERQNEKWVQLGELTPPPTPKGQIFPNDFTGNIILNNDILVVAARNAIYVYAQDATTNTWVYETQLPLAPQFSLSEEQKKQSRICGIGNIPTIAMSGNTIVVGNKTFGFDTAGYCATVFVRDSTTRQWIHQAFLLPNNCQSSPPCTTATCEPLCKRASGFGDSVAIDGDTIVIGTSTELPGPFDYCDEGGGDAAYIFERTPGTGNWKQRAMLHPSGLFERYLASRCGFGDVVAVKGDLAVVMGLRVVAHLFKHDPETGQWHYQTKLPYDGQSIGISRSQLMIGDTGISNKDSPSGHSGGFYSFDLRGTQFSQ